MHKYAIGLTILCLPLCVACSRVEYVPVAQELALPEHLTRPVPEPELAGDSNRDLVRLVLDTREALRTCNADKAALAAMSGEAGQ